MPTTSVSSWEPQSGARRKVFASILMPSGLLSAYARRATPNAAAGLNPSLPDFARHGPGRFLLHYICRHPSSHAVVFGAVLAAVVCAVGSQYGVKHLVDALSSTATSDYALWSAVAFLLALVAGDNLLWRLGGSEAARTLVAGGGDLRVDVFQA